MEPPARAELVELAVLDPGWPEEHRTSVVPLIRAAAAIGQRGRAWRLARVAWRFLFQHGYLADVVATCEAGLGAAEEEGDERGVALMNNYLASGLFRLGHAEEALSRITAMLEYQIRTGDRSAEGRARANLSGILTHLGRLAEGRQQARQAYRLLHSSGHRSGLAVLRRDLGYMEVVAGRYREALRNARIALQSMTENGSAYFQSAALVIVGMARLELGELDAAERILTAGLAAGRRHRIRTDEGEALNLLGRVELARGRGVQAVERHLSALKLAREHGRLPRVAHYSNDLARALRTVDDVVGAMELHRQALAVARRASYPLEEGRALSGLAECLAAQDPEGARRHWRQALDIFERMGVPEHSEVRKRLAELDG
ncbi:hypothetical protein ACPCHT_25825 [Nucisporomicrobium flavum]|uniref:hypothetical protein n=1 Tax=Nucisporomicrobium flavum TaxID=2785915 RepID=UPI003C2FB3B6